MCVGAHMREGGVGVRERIGLIDGQAEFAGFYSWQQISPHAAVDLTDFFCVAGTKADANIIDAFHRMQVEIELALHAAEAADIDDTAEYAGRLHVGVRDVARNLVDNEIDAFAASRFLRRLDLVRRTRIEREIGAELLKPRAPRLIGRGADDKARAHQFRDLQRHEADA